MAKRLLLVGADTPALQRVVPLLLRSDFQAHHVDSAADALQLLATGPFELIIVRHPPVDTSLPALVAAVRASDSPARTAGLLVLAAPDHVGELASLLGRGVNRVVNLDGPSDRLLQAVADLVGVAPRRTVRAVVDLELWVRRDAQRLLTLTDNVSTSGMLVRGGREFPVGAAVGFELLLPGGLTAVEGLAEVVRHTRIGDEGLEGIGLAFRSFAGGGEQRLAAFLERRSGTA